MKIAINVLVIFCSLFSPLTAKDTSLFPLFSYAKHKTIKGGHQHVEPSPEFEIILDPPLETVLVSRHHSLKIRLRNGLEVFLISDPKVKQSAASISIDVGSWNDPKEAPGLAHFVEHLLFMGSKKYPNEADFCRYVGERGGEYNAFTSHDRTVYGFCVNHEGFDGGLDRLAHFFIDPNFSNSSILREKKAVNHEFEDNIENDAVRIWRVLKETGNTTHPNATFSCGNLASLQNVTQDYVMDWFLDHYKASSMHLVLISPYSLNDMCQMCVRSFSAIAPGKGMKYTYQAPFVSDKQKGHMIYIHPSFKSRSLQMIWEVPKNLLDKFSIVPLQLIKLALDYDGKKSLAGILREKQLANDVGIDYWKVEKDHVLFLIEFALTKQGVLAKDEVIKECFQCLKSLQISGIPGYLFDHLYYADKANRQYTTPANVFSFAMDTALSLVEEDLDTFPFKTSVPSVFDEEKQKKFLQFLSPYDCIFFLMAPEQELSIKASQLEKWMKTPYSIRAIPDDKLNEWYLVDSHQNMQVRPPFNEKKEEIENPWENEKVVPETQLVYSSERAKIHLTYTEQPTEDSVTAFFSISNPICKFSPKHSALGWLFASYVQKKLPELISEDDHALSWHFMPVDEEFYLYIKAFGEKKMEAIQSFFHQVRHLPLDKELLENLRNQYTESYPGDPDLIEMAQNVFLSVLNPSFHTHSDILSAMSEISEKEYVDFTEEFFNKVTIEGVFHGNLSKEQTLSLWYTLENQIYKELNAWEDFDYRFELSESLDWEIPLVIHKKTHRIGNALLLVINLAKSQRETWAIQKILTQVLQEDFFEELRTKQQLAYKLFSWGETYQDRLLHYFAIQSTSYSPNDLHAKLEIFLDRWCRNFTFKVSKERIHLVRHMLILALQREKATNIPSDQIRWINASIQTLKSISYDDVKRAAKDMFSSDNQKRVAVFIEGECLNKE